MHTDGTYDKGQPAVCGEGKIAGNYSESIRHGTKIVNFNLFSHSKHEGNL